MAYFLENMQKCADAGSTDPHLPAIISQLNALERSVATLSLEDDETTAAYLRVLSITTRVVPMEIAMPFLPDPRRFWQKRRPVTTLAQFVFDLVTTVPIPVETYAAVVENLEKDAACGAMVLASTVGDHRIEAFNVGLCVDCEHPHFLLIITNSFKLYHGYLRGLVVTRCSSTIYRVLFEALCNITAQRSTHSLQHRQQQVLQLYNDLCKPWCPKFVEVAVVLPLLALRNNEGKKAIAEIYASQQDMFTCRTCHVFFPDLRNGHCSAACASKDPVPMMRAVRKLLKKYRCRVCGSSRSLMVPYCSDACWRRDLDKEKKKCCETAS